MNKTAGKYTNISMALATSVALTAIIPCASQAADITNWNQDNVSIEAPPYVPEETYTSTVFTDPSFSTTNGAVVWVESDVQRPGMKVVNDDDEDNSNCIMTAGYNPTDGTTKQCSDPFQTSKRFKETATVGDSSVDLVFDVSTSLDTNTYRVLQKYINAIAGTRIGSFTIQLGFNTGDNFVASSAADGLGFADRDGVVYDPIVATASDPASDIDLAAVFPFGLFGDADTNPNHDTDGYFDPDNRARFKLSAVEDSIISVGTPSANYFDLFNNWLAKDQVPYGYFFDDDGDPLTDATLIANWNGTLWETYTSASPQLPNTADAAAGTPVPVSLADLAIFVANPDTGDGVTPFYFVDFIDDLSNVNLNYHITVASDISSWPTYVASTGVAHFTLRLTNTAAPEAPLPWFDNLPSELADVDMAFSRLNAPRKVRAGTEANLYAKVTNVGTDPASGVVTIEGVDSAGNIVGQFSQSFYELAAGQRLRIIYTWTAPAARTSVTWTGTVSAVNDDNFDNDVQTDVTIVK
ncbi:MAG: choice-of-anchor F family protein [Gammaproteobacteria bacterium]